MKRLLQSIVGLLMILALAVAVLWLVQNAPNSSQELSVQTTPTLPPPVQWKTATSVSAAAIVAQAVTTATVAPTLQPTPIPTAIDAPTFEEQPTSAAAASSFELNFDTLKVISIEEVVTTPGQSVGTLSDGSKLPVGLSVDWSPDGQKALVARQATSSHTLSGERGQGPWTATQTVDLWVWDQPSGQELKVTNKAVTWDWSPDNQAVVYLTPVGEAGFEGELHIFNLETQTERLLVKTDLVQVYPGPFWLSSKEIMYMDEARFWTIQPDGSNRRLLNDLRIYRQYAEQAGLDEYSYAQDKAAARVYLAPDKTKLAYTTFPVKPYRETQLWLVDLINGSQVAMEGDTYFRAWATDSSFLLYAKRLGDGYYRDLWLTNTDGTNPRRLLDVIQWGESIDYKYSEYKDRPGDLGHIAISPDNKYLIFNDITETGLWLLDIKTGQKRILSQNDLLRDFYAIRWLAKNEITITLGNTAKVNRFRLILGE